MGTCEQLKDTPFAGSGLLYELIAGLRREPHQIFCERFSSKLYSPVVSENDQCYDPRNPSDMHQAVIDEQTKFPDTNYPKTNICPTGLSGGAIAGIVIGCLAGVALI